MKQLFTLLLCLAGLFAQAQTSYSQADITAASGNRFETLLTDVQVYDGMFFVEAFLQNKALMTESDSYYKVEGLDEIKRYEKKIIQGKEKQGYVYLKFYNKEINGYEYPITTKVEIWGDPLKVIEFYCGFWSRSLDFQDVDRNAIVSTRFLSDVATLSFPDPHTGKITVVPAKDR